MGKYRKDILLLKWNKEIDVLKLIITGLEKTLKVAEKFDGKVMNKRFCDALKTEIPNMYFSLNLKSSDSYCLSYSVRSSELEYEILGYGAKRVDIGRYERPLAMYEHDGLDVVKYINNFTRRLSYADYHKVIQEEIAYLRENIADTEAAISYLDQAIARAKKINEEIGAFKKDFPCKGLALETQKVDFYFLRY